MTTQSNVHQNAKDFVRDWKAYRKEVAKIIVGMDLVVELSGISFFSDGHFLLEAIPGAGKTTLALALSAAIKNGVGGVFQGTADLMPMDIIGSKAWDPEQRKLVIQRGAVTELMNVVVADETNRLAPKTASSLLMVMQERRLNIQGVEMDCADPFLVIGTQNPIEQEGVYALPEALLDRFCMKIVPGWLSRDQEIELVRRAAIYARNQAQAAGLMPVLTVDRMREMREHAQTLPVEPAVSGYIVDLVRTTRPDCDDYFHSYMPKEFRDLIDFGSGNRGGIWLTACAKAHAAMRGDVQVLFEDVTAVAPYVLSHRITLKPDVRFGGKRGIEREIISAMVAEVPTVGATAKPRQDEADDQTFDLQLGTAQPRHWWEFWKRG